MSLKGFMLEYKRDSIGRRGTVAEIVTAEIAEPPQGLHEQQVIQLHHHHGISIVVSCWLCDRLQAALGGTTIGIFDHTSS